MTEIIVALDVDTLHNEFRLLDQLKGTITFYKVGLQLFTAHGKRAVDAVLKRGGRVFLDLKLHDIPKTVELAVREAQRLGVESLSLHLSGGAAMLKAAASVHPRPELWGVTMLTSMTDADAKSFHPQARIPAIVARLAKLGWTCGVDATICSAQEVLALRKAYPNFAMKFVTPGIRPAGSQKDDQKRTMTPGEAARVAIDHLVIGRPITHAPDPLKAAQAILSSMRAAAPSALEAR